MPLVFDKLSNILEEKDIYLDEENFAKIKDLIIEKSQDLSMDYESENDLLILSFILLFLKDRDGLVDFRQIYEEIYKKLDKIAIFLK